jgi:hypothetical protein
MAVRLENLPGFNPHAATAEHVYPLDSVFPSEVAHALRSEAEELLTAVGNKARVDALREWVLTHSSPSPHSLRAHCRGTLSLSFTHSLFVCTVRAM